MANGSKRHRGGRRSGTKREQKPSFHIFCEGVNTEPLYFKQFAIPNIGHCKGYGQTKVTLVETALKYKRANRINKSSKDQIWVVFDYDYDGELQPKQKEDYNNAIYKAEKNNINCAVSNDAFELWYVLHYQNCDAQQLRTWYNRQLRQYTGEGYDKNRDIAMRMYDLLLPRQEAAIRRAETLYNQYDEDNRAHTDKNPFTSVHKLVVQLNKYMKK